MAHFDYQVGMPSASNSLTSREKRVENKVRKAAQSVWELREKFEGWGFSLLDPYVRDLIDESGYSVGPIQNEDGTWTVLISRKSDGKFDPARAQEALHELERADGLVHGPLRGDLRPLAAGLYSAAKTSLEKHGDLRDAVNAHTRWLTNEISASLLKPCMFALSRLAKERFPPSRIGAGWRKPWCTVVPLCISALLFLLSLTLVIGCYLLLAPTAGYGAAGICGLVYAQRYVGAREFRKERARLTRLWGKVSDLHNELNDGIYNAGEVIRRFREIEADDVRLPSIFVSVIALPELQPAKQGSDPA